MCGSPGTKPSRSPPVTKSSGGGNRPMDAATSIAASAAIRIRSCSSPCAVKCTTPTLDARIWFSEAEPDSRLQVLGGVREVFVLRQLAQSLGLDLPHALARQAELLADRLERGGAVTDETEAKLDHVALAIREVGDRLAHREIAERGRRLFLGRRAGAGDQVAERRVAVVTDSHVRRHDCARGGHDLLDVVERQLRVGGELLGRRVTLERRDELAAGAGDLLLALDDVHRDANRARLVGDATLHRLANPPGRVRGE